MIRQNQVITTSSMKTARKVWENSVFNWVILQASLSPKWTHSLKQTFASEMSSGYWVMVWVLIFFFIWLGLFCLRFFFLVELSLQRGQKEGQVCFPWEGQQKGYQRTDQVSLTERQKGRTQSLSMPVNNLFHFFFSFFFKETFILT